MAGAEIRTSGVATVIRTSGISTFKRFLRCFILRTFSPLIGEKDLEKLEFIDSTLIRGSIANGQESGSKGSINNILTTYLSTSKLANSTVIRSIPALFRKASANSVMVILFTNLVYHMWFFIFFTESKLKQ